MTKILGDLTIRWPLLAAAVGILLLIVISGCAGNESDNSSIAATGADAGAQVAKNEQQAVTFSPNQNSLETYKGLAAGFTDEGYPFRGDPEAPVTLVEYSDYLCPFCGRYFEQTLPALLDTYGATGQVNFVFRDFPLTSIHPTAPVGHAAALCVAEQGAALFWQMHDQLFANQDQWNRLGDPGTYVASLAEEIGADMDLYEKCMADGRTTSLVNDSVSEALAQGFGGTPTFQLIANSTGLQYPLVGAQPVTVFNNMLDALVAGEELPGGQQAAETTQLSAEERAAATEITFDFDGELETYAGLPAGFTEEGYPFLGNPVAPVSLVEFSDYLCPFCGRHFNQTLPALIETYGPGGDVNFVFRDYPLDSLHPTAHIGHEGALCAGEQGAALYWAMHDGLFAAQNQWANLPDPTDFVAGLAGTLGVDMETYGDCMSAGDMAALVQKRVTQGEALNFTGTPSFQMVVNESGAIHQLTGAHPLNVFTEMLDALIAGEELPEPEEPEPPELPFWANDEGLTPDPERPGYTLAGDPFKGDTDAPLVVVEFSDFQCPACGRHALETQPLLDAQFVDTGKILWVYKALPFKEHDQALGAAVVAECAGEQGQFWEMYHLLYEATDQWATAGSEDELIALARELTLDMESFSRCFDGRGALEKVVGDIYDAQGVVQLTPTFVVIQNGRGALYTGFRPADAFITILQNELQQAKND